MYTPILTQQSCQETQEKNPCLKGPETSCFVSPFDCEICHMACIHLSPFTQSSTSTGCHAEVRSHLRGPDSPVSSLRSSCHTSGVARTSGCPDMDNMVPSYSDKEKLWASASCDPFYPLAGLGAHGLSFSLTACQGDPGPTVLIFLGLRASVGCRLRVSL